VRGFSVFFHFIKEVNNVESTINGTPAPDSPAGRAKSEIGRKLLGIACSGAVKEAGMTQAEEKVLNLPFVFDAEVLASEYPTVDKTLAPLDAALDKLLKAHPQLDAAVKDLTAKR